MLCPEHAVDGFHEKKWKEPKENLEIVPQKTPQPALQESAKKHFIYSLWIFLIIYVFLLLLLSLFSLGLIFELYKGGREKPPNFEPRVE